MCLPRAVSLLVTVACLSGPNLHAESADARIGIDNFTFKPAEVVVSTGTKIIWTNQDDIPHAIADAAMQKRFKSSVLDTGETFSYVFSSSGTYHYFCSLHPHMRGTIVVNERDHPL
jgi:plastocyanin